MRGSRSFCQGGPGPAATNSLDDGFFLLLFFCVFLILNLFYRLQRGFNGFNIEKTIIFQGCNIIMGVQHLQGVQLFPGGVQMLIFIEIHITCDFLRGGGVRTPIPPWIRTWGQCTNPLMKVQNSVILYLFFIKD